MNNTVFLLFYEFFKIGMFTFGGGYGSLPFLYNLVDKYSWFNLEQLTQIIAISGITPGPIGLNMATFCGYQTLNIKGAIFTSMALILPMLIITSIVYKLYKKFSENNYVKSILYFLRPTSCALITSVAIKLFYELVLNKSLTHIDFRALFVILVLFLMTFKLPRNPIIYMVVAGFFGVIFFLVK